MPRAHQSTPYLSASHQSFSRNDSGSQSLDGSGIPTKCYVIPCGQMRYDFINLDLMEIMWIPHDSLTIHRVTSGLLVAPFRAPNNMDSRLECTLHLSCCPKITPAKRRWHNPKFYIASRWHGKYGPGIQG